MSFWVLTPLDRPLLPKFAGGGFVFMSTVSFSGLASGIDSEALIKATLDARRLANRPLERQIESNRAENKALQEFNTKLISVGDALKEFMTIAGGGLTKSGNSSFPDAVGISVSNSAPTASYNVTVDSLARGATMSLSSRFSSASEPVAPALGSPQILRFSLGLGAEAATYEIEVDGSTSLLGIAEQINSSTDNRLFASVVNLGSDRTPQFTLIVNSIDSGTERSTLSVELYSELSQALGEATIDQAQDAVFSISGIGQVTRQSNKISGIIPGVTFELKQAGPVPVTLTVSDDRNKTTEKFEKVVGLINEVIGYSKENSKVERNGDSRGGENVFGTLGKTRVDEQAIQSIRQALTDVIAPNGSVARTFADLGVSTERDGTLKFDRERFLNQIGADPVGAGQVLNQFADKLSSTGGVIDSFTRFQGVIQTSISSKEAQNITLQSRIDRVEDNLARQEQALKLLFTNLESRISRLNSSADAITSMLASSVRPKSG